MEKIFGGIDLNWKKLIIFAIIAGVYTAAMAMIPIASDTSFSDICATIEVWVLCGIFIIMNSKSAKDSALKCFVFFLISQPLVYLIQDLVNHSNLFLTYYAHWFILTFFTIPMGFVGYFMKKDKWWGLFILAPMLVLVGAELARYLSMTMFSFPRHLLTTIFCFSALLIYPIAIFKNKIVRIVGVVISSLIIIAAIIFTLLNPYVYSTDLLSNGEENKFDDTYRAYLTDESYGEIYIKYEDSVEDWFIHANLKKAGKTELVLESPTGEKTVYDVTIKRDTYDIVKKADN